MIDLTTFCGSIPCILCREPLHPCIGCHEARFRREKEKFEDPLMPCNENHSHHPYFYDSDTTVEDGYYSNRWDRDEDAYYEPRMDGRCFCCGRDHTFEYDVCSVYLENSKYWNKKMTDAYISRPNRGYQQYHPEEYYVPEGIYTYQNKEKKRLAMLEVTLSKLEKYLSAPNLFDEDRINCLVSKCQKLKMKIEIEECLSPLPDDIKDYSHMEEKVVEDNTTPTNLLSEEKSRVDQMVCEDDETEQSDEMNVYTEPLPISIIPINKCGEEGSGKKMKRAKLKDIGVYLVKWISENRRCFLNMPFIPTNLCRWHVIFRAFIGNTLGKCALRPP